MLATVHTPRLSAHAWLIEGRRGIVVIGLGERGDANIVYQDTSIASHIPNMCWLMEALVHHSVPGSTASWLAIARSPQHDTKSSSHERYKCIIGANVLIVKVEVDTRSSVGTATSVPVEAVSMILPITCKRSRLLVTEQVAVGTMPLVHL